MLWWKFLEIISDHRKLRSHLDGAVPEGQEEMRSLRLQKAMDRMSKMITCMRDLLEKLSTTRDAIVQNVK